MMRFIPSCRRWPAVALAVAVALPLASCDEFPKDPADTLQSTRGGTMEVGVIEGRPWVEIEDGEPRGVEVALAIAFSRSIDASIRWTRGTGEEVLQALENRQIDLVIGGLTQDSPWSRRVAFTRPYVETSLVVAARHGGSTTEIEGRPVVVSPGTTEAAEVTAAGGVPVAPEAGGPDVSLEAKPSWDLREDEVVVATLHRAKHVFAVPQGENAWLVTLDRFLRGNEGEVSRLLSEAAR